MTFDHSKGREDSDKDNEGLEAAMSDSRQRME